MRFQNPICNNQLTHLYTRNGIDLSKRGWSYTTAQKFYAKGIISYKDDQEETAQIRNTSKTLRTHVDGTNGIEIVWLVRYCSFFDCSADYLLGSIDKPTHAITDISRRTGLREETISKITGWYTVRDISEYDSDRWVSFLCDIIEDGNFESVLKDLYNGINDEIYEKSYSDRYNRLTSRPYYDSNLIRKATIHQLSNTIDGILERVIQKHIPPNL